MKKHQILVTDLLRRGSKTTRTLDVDPDDTIHSVMEQIEDATGFPPIVQMMELTFGYEVFFHDTPGTLAEHKLVVPGSPDTPVSVNVTHSGLTWTRLRAKTLRNLRLLPGDNDGEKELDSSELQLANGPGQEKMLITVNDYTRVARGPELMVLAAEAGDTVASLKEQVQRRRRYPVAMQVMLVSDADNPDYDKGTRMDKLDATLADYNVKKDSLIKLHMNMAFAVEVDREERGKSKVFKAKEIAAPAEQEEVSNSSYDDQK